MINLKKQAWRTGALCLAGVVALSAVSYTHLTLPTTERV